MRRRELLGLGTVAVIGAGLAAAQSQGVLDDGLRAIGVRPRPRPVPADEARLLSQARAQATLTAEVEAALSLTELQVSLAPIAALLHQQLAALGGEPAEIDVTATSDGSDLLNHLSKRLADESRQRERAARETTSPELAMVFASVSAGLAQAARHVSALR